MKIMKIMTHGLSWVIIVMLVMPSGIMAQDSEQTGQPATFTTEELAQMLAPIALYPDSLIAQILMASTYPIEVVEAERWLKQNKNLKADELDKALQEKTWDSSVKSLCHFPNILYPMSDNLERTTRLGDAFLGQQDDVMDTVQELRRAAQEQGNLRTTEQQNVIVENDDILIEPVNRQIMYVPVYDPLYVYGPWWYPAYPPYYWFYPPGAIIASGIIGFGFGIFLGIGIASWSWFDWHHHHIDIDIHKTGRFNRFDRGRWDFNRSVWTHEPHHRRGVAYRNMPTGQRFGMPAPRISGIRPEARGYPSPGVEKQGREPLRGTIERPGSRGYPSPGVEKQGREPLRGTIERREGPGITGGRMEHGGIERGTIRGNTFNGIGSGNFENRASERGFTSRQSGGFPGGGRGDGSRSGGHGGGGRR
jgi:Protein of unknown function (DUF3300)